MQQILSPWPRLSLLFERAQLLGKEWGLWFSNLVVAVNRTPQEWGDVELTEQQATISATAVNLPLIPSQTARYRLTYYLRKTQAAPTASSATVTLGWTDGGIACSRTFAALTTNTTASIQSNTLLVRSDTGTPITYAVAYASS